VVINFHSGPGPETFFLREEGERRHEVGLECLWASDYPHVEGTWPQAERMMCDTFLGLPHGDIATMLRESAAAFYGIDVERLAPRVGPIGPEKSLFAA
jgi:hypothetical protein